MAKNSLVFSVFLLLIFGLAISEIATAAKSPKICERGSKMYSGKCYNKLCDTKCKEWEKAIHGACHQREGNNTCFCYYDCDKAPPPADAGSPPPPPAAGGSPPPPADGGSPPPPTA